MELKSSIIQSVSACWCRLSLTSTYYGRVWYGMVGYGMVSSGLVGYGMVRYSTLWRYIPEYSVSPARRPSRSPGCRRSAPPSPRSAPPHPGSPDIKKCEIQCVPKKMEYSGLFGAFKSLLCLTILPALTVWIARACLGTTGNIFCPCSAPYSPYKPYKRNKCH